MNTIQEIREIKKKIYFLIRRVGTGNNTLEGLSDVDIYEPSNNEILKYNSSTQLWENGTGSGSGTVTTVSVVSANGLAGTVANATTTPAITLSTSITGILKGNGTAISAAAAGTDYEAAITTLPIAKGGTNSGTALSNNRVMKSSSGAIVEAAAITASMILQSDGNGIPTHTSLTETILSKANKKAKLAFITSNYLNTR